MSVIGERFISDAEMAVWVAAGIADPSAIEVLWHAAAAQRRGQGAEDCPFEDQIARRRWLGVVVAHQSGALSQAGTKTKPVGRQWWMD